MTEYTDEPIDCFQCKKQNLTLSSVSVNGVSRQGWVCDDCGWTHIKTEPLETPEDSLGIAVDGCSEAPNGNHEVDPHTVQCVSLELEQEAWVLDGNCRHCGMSGSRRLNLKSFNWD